MRWTGEKVGAGVIGGAVALVFLGFGVVLVFAGIVGRDEDNWKTVFLTAGLVIVALAVLNLVVAVRVLRDRPGAADLARRLYLGQGIVAGLFVARLGILAAALLVMVLAFWGVARPARARRVTPEAGRGRDEGVSR